MATVGGQAGNHNAARGKRWRDAITRALARKSTTVDGGLDVAADKLVALAQEGDKWAIDHIADRLDGKAMQPIDANVTGELGHYIAIPVAQRDSDALGAAGGSAVPSDPPRSG